MGWAVTGCNPWIPALLTVIYYSPSLPSLWMTCYPSHFYLKIVPLLSLILECHDPFQDTDHCVATERDILRF